MVDRKGKSRSSVLEEEMSESSVPSRIFVNHPSESSRSEVSSRRTNGVFESAKALVPRHLQARITSLSKSGWFIPSLAIPVPIIILAATFIAVHRRLARSRHLTLQASTAVARTVAASSAISAMEDIRTRLVRVRGRGVLQRVWWWLRWWIVKFAGVWKLGTTVTYV